MPHTSSLDFVASATLTGSVTAPAVLAAIVQPVAALSISTGMILVLSYDTKFSSLCLFKDNWPKWSRTIVAVTKMGGLDGYLYGWIPTPNVTVDPVSFKNWKGNNKKLIGFLKAHVEHSEETFLSTDNAHTAWNNLRDRHEKQGPNTQVRLIQKALSISYSKDVSTWSATTSRLRDLCTLIFAQGALTFDVLFMVVMLNGLEREANDIRCQMTSHCISNAAVNSTTLANRIEQEVIYRTRRKGFYESAPGMHPAKKSKRSPKICSNPLRPTKIGHTMEVCYTKGGAMEGKMDEVLAAKAKERAYSSAGSPAPR